MHNQKKMRCYYEELNVPRDASDGDIKTAYRKLALRWHPDKNPDSSEEAKERFQLIQQAYEVLSDAHERAWYDNHREQILRGKNSDYEENCLDLFQYFTVSCFKGYGDDENGFYAVYREVFKKIAAEDAEFIDDEEEIENIPEFGNSQSSYDEVVGPFYAYWQAYCTKKTYTWLCPYDVQGIKDRRILRRIEKETKTVAQKAKRERNEEVRNLVSFIRKRDKRVQANRRQLEERAVLNRQKQEQNRLEQIRKRQKELAEASASHNHAFNEEYEEQLKQLEQEYDSDISDEEDDGEDDNYDDSQYDLEGSEDDDDNEDEGDDIGEEYLDDSFCTACNKKLKGPRSISDHWASKKHQENVERIKKEMLAEEESFQNRKKETNHKSEEQNGKEEDSVIDKTDALSLTEDGDEAEAAVGGSKKKNKKSKKSAKSINVISQGASDHEDCDVDFLSKAKAAEDDSDDEEWRGSKKAGKRNKNKKPNKTRGKASDAEKGEPAEATVTEPSPIADEKPKPEQQTKAQANKASGGFGAPPTPLQKCVTCGTTFPSKNKLFAHLKLMNHGVYIPKDKAQQAAEAPSGKAAKGKRK